MGKSSSDDEEEVYVVEAILADRPDKFTGQQRYAKVPFPDFINLLNLIGSCLSPTRYLIKWKDYGEEDNSWEPASVSGCFSPSLLSSPSPR
jgi:hypothetical protein